MVDTSMQDRPVTAGIIFRAALPADAYALAELSIMAGDGMYEFLLEEMAPREMLAGLIARSMKQDAGGFSWRHCFVADDKGVVGMINAFPAAWLRDEERDILPQDRVQILDPIDQAQDWESFLVNSVAVRPQHRRRGIGTRLLEMAIERGLGGSFARLTANVWADNVAARNLFERQGFAVQTRVEIPPHPALAHVGGSLLMARQIGAV
jgi:ribosomal protein S18 acetylase RimI-like enzyme